MSAAVGVILAAALAAAAEATRTPQGLSAAVVEAARRDLGVREVAPNSGPEIDAWIRDLGLSPPAQWCAAAVTHWIRAAAKATGLPAPIKGAAGAKLLLAQFQAAGKALSPAAARAQSLPPGTVLVWDRAVPPMSSYHGHTGIVESDDGETWTTIEGNTEQNDVRRVKRTKADSRLMGAGLV